MEKVTITEDDHLEEKLTQSLDCFMKVAMALRTDQVKLATTLVQLRTEQETLTTNVVQIVDKIKARLKDLEHVQANFMEENAKLKGEMATMMRTIANEIWSSKATCFFGMVEARIDKEIDQVRGMMCLGEISDDEFGDSADGG